MYSPVAILYDAWYDAIGAKFGPTDPDGNERENAYLRRHDQEFNVLHPADINPEQFPWCFLSVSQGTSQLTNDEVSMSGGIDTFKVEFIMVIMTMGLSCQSNPFRITNKAFRARLKEARLASDSLTHIPDAGGLSG